MTFEEEQSNKDEQKLLKDFRAAFAEEVERRGWFPPDDPDFSIKIIEGEKVEGSPAIFGKFKRFAENFLGPNTAIDDPRIGMLRKEIFFEK